MQDNWKWLLEAYGSFVLTEEFIFKVDLPIYKILGEVILRAASEGFAVIVAHDEDNHQYVFKRVKVESVGEAAKLRVVKT